MDDIRYIVQLSITNDKRYLAASTMHEFVVFDLLKDSVLMELTILDEEYNQSDKNKFGNIKFINKKKTLLATKNSNLLEYDYQTGTLLSDINLGGLPEFGNFDISDSEDFATYALWYDQMSNHSYILDLETKKYEKITTGELKVLKSYFILNDQYLHLSRTCDTLNTQLYSINEKRAFFCDIPKSIDVVRSKLSNRVILHSKSKIVLIDGTSFISDISKCDKSTEVLIHPNTGTTQVTIDVNLSAMGFYKLKI